MSTPTRRHSRAVYRRRRLVLFLGLVLIAALVWLFIAQPWRSWAATGDATPASTTSQSPSPSASATTPPPDADADAANDPAADETDADEDADADEPSPSATPAVEPCTRSELEVVAGTDKDSYATGENPQLTITLTNRSTVACTLNVGTSAQTFEVSSGSDVWWRSTDCQAKPSDMTVTIAAGQSVSSAKPLTWDRTRSSVDSCKSETRPQAPGGGATYHLNVSIGGVHSETTKAFMLY